MSPRTSGRGRRAVAGLLGRLALALAAVLGAAATPSGALGRTAGASADAVAGAVVVILDAGADQQKLGQSISRAGWTVGREVLPGRVWTVAVPARREAEAAAVIRGWLGVREATQERRIQGPPPPSNAPGRLAYALRGASATPNDRWYSLQWAHTLGRVAAAWEWTVGSAAIGVGIVDSGFDVGHPDSPASLFLGPDYVNGGFVTYDASGHGTHVVGIVAAAANNAEGVAGVAPGVTVFLDRAFDDQNRGSTAALAAAIIRQADVPQLRVTSLSLGGSGDDPAVRAAVEYSLTRGKLIVAAAGNDGATPEPYPARYAGVLAVGAVGPSGFRAGYSNYGAAMRNGIAAPGGAGSSTPDDPTQDVLSTYPRWKTGDFGYRALAGTSMAAPFVSGVAGLVLSANPSLTGEQVIAILRGSARPNPEGLAAPNDYYGAGIVDAGAAVATAVSQSAPTATPTPSPTPTAGPSASPTTTPTAGPAVARQLLPLVPRRSGP
jgi:subtilisin family serine protease